MVPRYSWDRALLGLLRLLRESGLCRVALQQCHIAAWLQSRLTGRHDLFAGLHTRTDDGRQIAQLRDGDAALLDRTVGFDDIDVLTLRPLLPGRRGGRQRVG